MEIAFYRGEGPYMAVVRAYTRSPYGHVAMRDGGLLTEAATGGVTIRAWGSNPQDAAATLLPLPGPNEQRVREFLAEQVGKPYDYSALFLDAVFRRYIKMPPRLFGILLTDQTQNAWDCSRLSAWACTLSGWRGPGWFIPATPGGLYDALTQNPLTEKR